MCKNVIFHLVYFPHFRLRMLPKINNALVSFLPCMNVHILPRKLMTFGRFLCPVSLSKKFVSNYCLFNYPKIVTR